MITVELSDAEIAVVVEALQYAKRAKLEGSAPAALTKKSVDLIDQALSKLSAAKPSVESS